MTESTTVNQNTPIESDIITTVFIDIEDSTGIANYLKKEDYEDFLKAFHKVILKVLNKDGYSFIKNDLNCKFMGDEFIAFIPHDREKGAKDIIALRCALHLAATLKYEWYFSEYNHNRIFGDKELIEFNIGINTGAVSKMISPILSSETTEKHSYEGFPITLAKRIQSVAEESQSSRIIVADRYFREYTASAEQPISHEFNYLGPKSFKGIAQKFSCYEWTGDDFYKYLDYPEYNDVNVEDTLKALYKKNPHNPWYASLLANYYYSLGEDDFWRGTKDSAFYGMCAEICTTAIHNIAKYNLRKLNDLLFDCIEVTKERWDELSFRTEQAYTVDQTFARALALHAKSRYMHGKPYDKKSERKIYAQEAAKAAEKVITLFSKSNDFESLFLAHITLARFYAVIDKNRQYMIDHIKAAVECVINGGEEVDWGYSEYEDYPDDFVDYQKDTEFMAYIEKLQNIYKEE
jgi:class 3 adenylate cyclase